MTVAVAWVKQCGSSKQLLIASDSRICGGLRWDQCPKIITLPRSDCAICFAGQTEYAYPMMMQIFFAMGSHAPIVDRAMDICDVNGYALKHVNQLYSAIYDVADPASIEENEFVFAGYSWRKKDFMIWRYFFDKINKKFTTFTSSMKLHNKKIDKIIYAGDMKKELKKELYSILEDKYGKDFSKYNNCGFDMEPMQALINLLKKTTRNDTIGGAPQLVKIFPFMQCRPIGIYWPHRDDNKFKNNRTLLGRKLPDFENSDHWFMDPDTLVTHKGFVNLD
ncbi:hypothetical protein [Desulfovibrio sp. QI0434]